MTAAPELAAGDQNFDRDTSRALARGRLVPQASLDLHGMTLAAAERAVAAFLEHATARDLRVVLVVTGKGLRLEGGRMLGGRIRAEFVGWLNRADNRHRVRAVRAAHPRHGGGGAFYVLLRRRPSASRSAASSRSLRATPQR
jgi:DNA-nicking Smr family endonuclease